jgi:DNA-binding winged helix-turn-helix (wHTH) protein
VQIASIRRALGDGRDCNRFLINIPGRGYRFVAPIKVAAESEINQQRSIGRTIRPFQSVDISQQTSL